jgi:hypothetical protein
VGGEALGRGERPDRRGDPRQAVAVDVLDLTEATVGLDGQRAGRTGEATRRQDVVRAGRVVAGRLRRPRPDEDRARVADPGRGGLGVGDVDREVLRGVAVDERDRGAEVRRKNDPAVLAECGPEDVAALVTSLEKAR